MTAVERFAEWISDAPRDHGSEATNCARDAVQDTMACIFAGQGEDATLRVAAAAADWGDGSSTLFGHRRKASAPVAALVNGTAAHALDFDDWDYVSHCHTSAVLVPALFALGESLRATGGDLLDAYIVGAEVIMRIGEAINPMHIHAGWHPTSSIGSLGAAAACARLLQLDSQAAANALSIATSMTAGMTCQFGTMTKPAHAGFAAQAGVMAAQLAAAGLTASVDALDGGCSILSLRGGVEAKGFDGPLNKLFGPRALTEFGLVTKLYPCCGCISKVIDGVRDLRDQHGLNPWDVRAVTARLPSFDLALLQYPQPADEMQARFSLQYGVAVALVTGHVKLKDFTPESVVRRNIGEVMAQIEAETFEIESLCNDSLAGPAHSVTMQLVNGKEVTIDVPHARGMPSRPLSETERNEKYLEIVSERLGSDLADASLSEIRALNDVPNLSALASRLNSP